MQVLFMKNCPTFKLFPAYQVQIYEVLLLTLRFHVGNVGPRPDMLNPHARAICQIVF